MDGNRRPPLLVIGNQAGDLDSTVCTLALARLLRREGREEARGLIRGGAADFRLKPEIPALLAYAEVPREELLFEDSPQGKALLADAACRYFLVDHNRPRGVGRAEALEGILDHHRDEGCRPDLPLRRIRLRGSCATLTAEEWARRGRRPDRKTALLLAAAILVDTGNFAPAWGKTTEADREQFRLLGRDFTREDREFLAGLPAVKADLSQLSPADLLRRDYKDLPGNPPEWGIASLPLLQEEFFRPAFYADEAVENFMARRGLRALFLMHTGSDPFRRQLSCCAGPEEFPALKEAAESLAADGRVGLIPRELPLPSSLGWLFFHQENLTLSRKALLPLLADRHKPTNQS